MGQLISAEEVEAKTTIDRSTLYSWRSRKRTDVPTGFKLGKRVVYDEDEVDAWIDAQRRAAQAAAQDSRAGRTPSGRAVTGAGLPSPSEPGTHPTERTQR